MCDSFEIPATTNFNLVATAWYIDKVEIVISFVILLLLILQAYDLQYCVGSLNLDISFVLNFCSLGQFPPYIFKVWYLYFSVLHLLRYVCLLLVVFDCSLETSYEFVKFHSFIMPRFLTQLSILSLFLYFPNINPLSPSVSSDKTYENNCKQQQ